MATSTRQLEGIIKAYWKLDSTYGAAVGADSIGSNTLNIGSVGSTTGKINEAASFTRASSQYLSVVSNANIQSLKSFAFWVKFTTISNDMTIVHKGSVATAANSSVWIKYDTGNNRLQYQVGDGAGGSATASTSGFTFATGVWYFVCCRCDTAAQKLSISVNGAVYGTGAFTLTQFVETGTLYLGRSSSGDYLDGSLDEVCCSASSFTIAEELVLYNGGTGTSLPFLEGPIGVSSSSNRYPRRLPPSFAQADNGNLYIAYGDEGVRKWDGLKTTFPFAGVPAPEDKPAITSGGSGRIIGDRYAYVRYLDEDGRVSNLSPISDKHSAFGSYKTITAATNAAPIVITSASHGLTTGDRINIQGIQGNTAANGDWYVTVLTSSTFQLVGSVGNGDFLGVDAGSVNVRTLRDGVAAVNEVQSITASGTPSGGTWTITHDGSTTSALAHTANAAAVQAALESLSSIGSGNVTVSGGGLGTAAFVVTFVGVEGGMDQPLMTVTNSLAGANVTVSVVTLTEGSPAQSEVQQFQLYGNPSGGTFTLTYAGQTTAGISNSASNATVTSALEALSNIGVGDVSVSGGALPGAAVTVTFQGALANTNVQEMTINGASLTGGSIGVAVSTVTPGVPGGPDGSVPWTTRTTPTTSPSAITYGAGLFVVPAPTSTQLEYWTSPDAITWTARSMDPTVTNSSGVVAGFGNSLFVILPYSATSPALLSTDGLTWTATNNPGAQWLSVAYGNSIWVAVGSSGGVLDNVMSASASADDWTLRTSPLPADWNSVAYGDGVFVAVGTNRGSSTGKVMTSTDGVTWTERTPATTNLWISVTYGGGLFVAVSGTGSGNRVMTSPDGVTWTSRTSASDSYWTSVHYSAGIFCAAALTGTTSCLMTSTDAITWTMRTASKALNFPKVSYGNGLFAITSVEGTTSQVITSSLNGGVNEVQRITVSGSPSQGSFALTYSGQTTAAIAYNATAVAVDAALEALSNIGSGDVSCSGGPLPGSVVDVEFTGTLAQTDVSQMTANDNLVKCSISTTTQGDPGTNEVQRISASPTPLSGTFTLTFDGQTTSALNFNATAAEIDAALEALSNIGAGDVSCSGGPINSSAVTVIFGGALAATNVAQMTASSSLLGAAPSVSVATTTSGAGAVNERQQVYISGLITGGSYTLSYSGQTTSALDYTSTATQVDTSLEALSNIGAGDVTTDGGALNSVPVNVEFTGALAGTNVSQMTVTNSVTAGGFARGAQYITYSNIGTPTDRRVVRRQILRNKFGDATVFYVDVDTTDLTSTSFTSYKTDEELTTAVALQDVNGNDLNVVRHGEPPNHKRAIAAFLNRLFLAVNHRSTSGELTTTASSTTLTGEDAFFRTVYDGRNAYPQGTSNTKSYEIDSLSVPNQTLTTTVAYNGTTSVGVPYAIEKAEPDDLVLYFSELDDPEWWNALNGLTVAREEQDGEFTGLAPLVTSMLLMFEHRLYKLSFRTSPLLSSNPDFGGDGRILPASWRGCVSHRCCVKHAGKAYLLDTKGIYSYDDNSVEELSDPISPVFSAGSPFSIYWPAKESFHAVSDIENDTVKWFVVLGDGMYPRHALCYHTERKRWWIEELPFPITSSCVGRIGGRQVVFYGSTSRRLFLATENLDAISVQTNNLATLRGTVTSSNTLSLTDSSASFPAGISNVPVVIVSGTGAGQQNTIISNTSTVLTLLNPWLVKPNTTSVYQIGGLKWRFKTSMMKLDQKGSEEMRGVQMLFTPTSRPSTVVMRAYPDFSATAESFVADYSSDGITTTNGSDQIVADMTQSRGYVEVSSDSYYTGRGGHQRYVTLELTGVTNGERQKINQIDVVGAES